MKLQNLEKPSAAVSDTVDVIADSNYSNVSEAYNHAFRAWRNKEDNPYAFRCKKQKKEAEKEKKKDTKLVSYEMFCQGMSIDEIAKARELVSGTIAGHLEYYVRLGKIKVEKVVKAENLAKIRKHLEEHEYMGIFAIKAALGDDVSYADIKFVLAVSGH